MMNTSNFGILRGRMVEEPKLFTNKDNSRKVFIKIAAKDNFKGKNNEKGTQFITLEGLISKDKNTNGVYDYLHKGDKLTVQYEIRNNNYEKDGVMHYGISLFIKAITLEESKKKNTEIKTEDTDVDVEIIEIDDVIYEG